MSTTMINVMAHKGAQDVFERHFNYWVNLVEREQDLVVWCPSDAVVKCPGIQVQAIYPAQHIGDSAMYRVWHIMDHINKLGYDRYAFFEYDSICLSKELPEVAADFAANIFPDEEGFLKGEWKGKMFTHPPLIFTAEALGRLLYVWESIGVRNVLERGVWDRALGFLVEEAKLSTVNFLATSQGFAANTIHPPQFPDLRKAVLDGVTMIHGCKTPECLKVIQRARELWEMKEELKKEGICPNEPDR